MQPNLINSVISGKNNPAINNTSVLDFLGGVGVLNYSQLTRISDSNDQLWTTTNGTAQIQGQFTADADNFGVVNGTAVPTSLSFANLINGTGLPYNQSATVSIPASSQFQFALDNASTGTILSSANANNGDLMDHMVTFEITDASSPFYGDYILAFEDLLQGQAGADFDYNDTIVLVSGVTPIAVPEPATYAILGSGLALALLLQRRRARVAS